MKPADDDDKPIFVGRFNVGAVSMHLPMILAKSRAEGKDFYEVLDYYLEMIRGVHKRTYEYVGNLRASTNPVQFCEGGILGGHLKPTDKVAPLLKPMTASFGITALNELQQLYNGKSLVEDGQFALEVLQYINDKVNEFKKEDGWLYAIYGTPAESLCFAAGTQVQAYVDGKTMVKNIEDIRKNDLVYSFNEISHKIELKPVIESKMTKEQAKVIKVEFTNGQSIICTPDHPFAKRSMIRDSNNRFWKGEVIQYVEARLLKPGNRIKSNYVTIDGGGHLVCTTNQWIHDINAEYILGKKPDGYVTHHSTDQIHPYSGINNHTVKSVTWLDDMIPVYDIEVADNHNFYVGGMSGILVHNCALQVDQFRKLYGVVKNVSDKGYVSNSFHCHVSEDITPIEKQDLENRFWNLCNGGKIQYVRYPINYNTEAIRTLLKRAMDMGYYEGVNLSLAYCEECGYQQLDMDKCPKCGSELITKVDRMNGYLSYSRVHGHSRLNDGKMEEIKDRVSM